MLLYDVCVCKVIVICLVRTSIFDFVGKIDLFITQLLNIGTCMI